MGRRGPLPTPPNVVRLRGNPGQRPIRTELVVPLPPAPLEPPDFLTGYALEEWRRLAPVLHELNLLTELDLMTFGVYCDAVASWQKATESHAAGGSDPASPLVRVVQDAGRHLIKVAGEFGLTPATRVRVRAGLGGPPGKFTGLVS
jgi:P27 family predicted phage terminase small subunit